MRSKDWIRMSQLAITLLMCLMTLPVLGQEDGGEDLGKALDQKLKATSTTDLDAVVRLCRSAIKKGLSKDDTKTAQQLAAAASYEHADQLNKRIGKTNRDPRWRVFRSAAIRQLKNAVEFDPEMGEAYLMIADLNALEGGDRDAALEAVEKAVELAGDDREQLSAALFSRSMLAEDQEAQLADLSQAIKVNPENIEAVRLRGIYYLRKREPEMALDDLNKWLDSDQKEVGSYLFVVENMMASGEKFNEEMQQEAIKIIDKAIKIAPKESRPYALRAEIHLDMKELELAEKDANKAVELNEENIEALLTRSEVYSALANYEKALEDANATLAIRPGLVAGLERRGIIYSQQQDFDGAIKDFKTLVDSGQFDFYRRQLGVLYNAADRPTQAARVFAEILQEVPADSWEGKSPRKQLIAMDTRASALRGRADAWLASGKHKEAVEDYEEALELNEKLLELQDAEGMGNLVPIDDGALNNLAWVLATSTKDDVRDGKRAIEFATRAAEATEFKEAHILSTLASGYAESGDFDKAIEWLEKAIEINRVEGEEAKDKTRTDKQRESLGKELESYKNEKPWRELQDVENEAKEKSKKKDDKKKNDKKKESDEDGDESDEDDSGEKDSSDKDDKKEDDKDDDSDDKEEDKSDDKSDDK
ncbi:MAG: tetratricopeptide repeat protein [Mariniblastus sp.]